MATRTHYPSFDVMESAPEWDEHTRTIVEARLRPRDDRKKAFTAVELETLLSVARHLLADDRSDILSYVLSHIEKKVKETFGESQRPQGIPKEADLIRQGLSALSDVAQHRHQKAFDTCTDEEQFMILAALQNAKLEAVGQAATLPQKEFFKKIHQLIVESYASHPEVWSEMGYAGPAYPRGYYRIERGLTDPWEARQDAQGDEGP